MVTNHKELPRIIEVLKENPRGMSVTQIAEAIGMNRISIARYLDVLLTAGQVEMVRYGQAKLYFISHRVPLSALLDFSSDLVAVLERDQNIVQVNSNFLNLIGMKREEIIGQSLEEVLSPVTAEGEFHHLIERAFKGEEVGEEILVLKDDQKLFFDMNIIPTAFADSSNGITLVLEDITEQKNAMQALIESESKFRQLVEQISDLLVNVEEYATLNDQIRDPLQAIVGYADYPDPDLTEKIYTQAKEIDGIITQLDIGRIEADNIRKFLKKHFIPKNPERMRQAASPNAT
jgi:PAS domain S-box-containing protein